MFLLHINHSPTEKKAKKNKNGLKWRRRRRNSDLDTQYSCASGKQFLSAQLWKM
jgi:hypothetical protein